MCKKDINLMHNDLFVNSYIDLTTGLKNKNYISFILPKIIHNNYSALLIDLNDFKVINDIWNYKFGNKVLNEVSKILLNSVTNKSIITHFDSDKFLIIAFEEKNINEYAEKILSALKSSLVIEDIEVNLTANIGIYTNTTYDDVSIAIQNADIALNYAKKKGKDCFCIFNTSMKDAILRKSKIQKKLKEAINNDLLQVYYQPKINLKTEQYIGAEALLRWNDKEFGNISPSEFIPIAEETGIIIELGRYVLKKVCRQIKTWELRGIDYINVSVNVSAEQFRDLYLSEFILSILKEYELNPNILELEITETAIIRNIDHTAKMLNEFIKKDINIALDDFGTGYSSYSYISNLNLNTLKIDKSFVDFINCDFRKNLIIRNIIDFAHILGMNVVAEGVEHEHQIKTLKEYECDIIQGYYYSKPLPVQDFEEYINKRYNFMQPLY